MIRFSLILLSVLFSNFVFSQTTEDVIRNIIEEKLHHEGRNLQIKGVIEPRDLGKYEKEIAASQFPESEIHAAINPTDSNNIVVCPMQFELKSGITEIHFPIYFTKDFGNTWHKSNFEVKPGNRLVDIRGGGDPIFAFDANGKLYFSWIHLYKTQSTFDTGFWGMHWAYSNDGGETWNQSSNDIIGQSFGIPYISSFSNIKIVHDKQWMACDQSNSAYQNNLYVAYLKADLNKNEYFIALKTKLAGIDTFENSEINISKSISNVQFAGIDVDGLGGVHVIFVSNKNIIWHCVSNDGGQNFSYPKQIVSLTLPDKIEGIKYTGSSPRLYPASQLVIDKSFKSPYYNHLYVTFTGAEPNQTVDSARGNIYLIKSEDFGNSWSQPFLVYKDAQNKPRDQFYSNMFINENGIISMCFYGANESDSLRSNDQVNYYLTKSIDGGLTFSGPLKISSEPTDFKTIGIKNNGNGILEYNQVVSTTSYAFPIWSDGRTGNGDLNVLVSKINLYRFTEIPKTKNINNRINNLSINSFVSNKSLSLKFEIDKPTTLYVSIFDLSGKLVYTYKYDCQQAGIFSKEIDLNDLSSGDYIAIFQTDFAYYSKKIIIAK